jgi:hypothetical protein
MIAVRGWDSSVGIAGFAGAVVTGKDRVCCRTSNIIATDHGPSFREQVVQ